MSTAVAVTLSEVRAELLRHPIYKAMSTPESVRIFMQHHVFAVWDFMSLLKRLQQDLTCTAVPWLPPERPHFARFINEIVLGEETDEDGRGGFASHFDLYLEAMEEVGADIRPIRAFIRALKAKANPHDALKEVDAPESVRQFVKGTLDLAGIGGTHQVCASFFFGREDIIPDMFQVLVDELNERGQSADRLTYYLNRHIELDGDEHGPLAEKLLAALCDGEPHKVREADEVAVTSLQSRILLWDGALTQIRSEA